MPPKRKSKPRSPDHLALGQAIELLLEENDEIDRDSLSRESGLDDKQLGTLMRGTGNPTFTTLLRLSFGLHVRMGTLMTVMDKLRDKRT